MSLHLEAHVLELSGAGFAGFAPTESVFSPHSLPDDADGTEKVPSTQSGFNRHSLP